MVRFPLRASLVALAFSCALFGSVSASRALSADLSITKTDGVLIATPGGSVTYTITASNAGVDPSPATVADTFPATLTCTWTCIGTGGGTCTAAGSGNINDSVNLPVGGSVTYTVSCGVSAAATGAISNMVTVVPGGGVTDPDLSNNSAKDMDTLTPLVDLAVTKTDGVTLATPGGSVTYTIVASNAGPSNAPGSTVADTFPAVLTCTWICVGAGGGTCTAAGAGNINDTVNLPVGGSVTYTASCTISGAATGTISNTATVTPGVGITDPSPGNNSEKDLDTLGGTTADLVVTKTDGVTVAVPGGSVLYTIVASNAGPDNAPGSTVADSFPAVLTCTWTCAGAGGGICTAAGVGNVNDTVNLPVGGSVTYTANCAISAAAAGTLANTATASTGVGITDPVPGNNSATDTDALSVQVNLAITKSDGLTHGMPGQASTYTIVASNSGPSFAVGSVTDTFPAGFVGASWTCVGADGGTCTAVGSGNIPDTVTLPPGGSVTYTVSGSISDAFVGTLSNTARVTSGSATATATDITQVSSAAAILGIKSAVGIFQIGSVVTYTILLGNGSASEQRDNPGDELVDVLPSQLTLVSAVATSGTAMATVETNTVIWNGSIPADGSVIITIQATVNPGTTGQIVSNQAIFSYDADGDGTNEATGATDDPALPGGTDATRFTVRGSAFAIPTLDGIGLAALALVLAALAAGLLRKRRSA